MPPRESVCRPSPFEAATPFGCAVEAWLWSMLAWRNREEGGGDRAAVGPVPRPCEPEDVLRAAEGLRRRGRLTDRHVEVLARCGYDLTPPDPLEAGQGADARLWEEAMRRLEPALRAKGIVT